MFLQTLFTSPRSSTAQQHSNVNPIAQPMLNTNINEPHLKSDTPFYHLKSLTASGLTDLSSITKGRGLQLFAKKLGQKPTNKKVFFWERKRPATFGKSSDETDPQRMPPI
jgi:hypothetical protein